MSATEMMGDRDFYDGRPVGPHNFCEEFVEIRSDPWAGAYCVFAKVGRRFAHVEFGPYAFGVNWYPQDRQSERWA